MNVHKENKNLILQHTTQHNSNTLEDVQFWCIPCCKIIDIKNSVCAQDDNFFSIQQISRKSYKELIENSQLIDEFERICKGFTFVYSWDDTEITP